MAGLTPGYFYVIEAEDAQQDWRHDPDDIVIGNFTEGTHFFKIEKPLSYSITSMTGSKITTIGGALQYSFRENKRYSVIIVNGKVTTISNANLINKFVHTDRHTSGASATFVPYYAILYNGLNASTLVPTFIDHNNTERAYCLGEIIQCTRNWIHTDNERMTINIKFASVWRTV